MNSRLMGVGTIPWSEIGALVEHHTPVQMVLTIKLIDSASLYAGQSRLGARVRFLLRRLWILSNDIVVGDAMLPISIHELIRQIRGRYQHELTRHGIRVIVGRGK